MLIRRGPRSQFIGPAFVAAEHSDLLRLADATGTTVRPLPETLGGVTVDLVDPSGIPVRVVSGTHQLEAAARPRTPHVFNFGPSHDVVRANATQRPPRVPTKVQRLGHIVLQTPKYLEALNWYLDHLGLIVSDFCYYPGQRERGPVMSFIRCDRGSVPADHHTLAMALGPANRYVHSAYQVSDLDALAAGGEYLREQGYFRSWGIGRHIQGSQIFDYWRDPDGVPGRALRRRRHVRQHPRARLGPVGGLRPGPVGPAAEQGLPGHRIAARNRERARRDARCAAPRQRVRPVRPARAVQRSQFLTHQTQRK